MIRKHSIGALMTITGLVLLSCAIAFAQPAASDSQQESQAVQAQAAPAQPNAGPGMGMMGGQGMMGPGMMSGKPMAGCP
jgi:hypothetical protein